MKRFRLSPLRTACLILTLFASLGTIKQSAQTLFRDAARRAHAADAGGPSPAECASSNEEQARAEASVKARAGRNYGSLPLSFEVNRGQTASQVKFLARGGGYSLFLTSDEAVLSLQKGAAASHAGAQKEKRKDADARKVERAVVRMKLKGANSRPRIKGLDELPNRSNYIAGRDPKRWLTGVPNYGSVRYESVYPGVDLIYYGNQRQLEYDFRLAPAADAARIAINFKGAESITLDEEGQLVLQTAAGELRQLKPVAFQQIDGRRREVACRYRLKGTEVGFELGEYDTTKELVIDPVLSYSTYLGGNGQDEANAIDVDRMGNAYVAGTSVSSNFPTTPGAFQRFPSGTVTTSYDAFVAKLNPEGTALVYTTFIGGWYGDSATGIKVDFSGEALVTGETASPNFPVTSNAFQPSLRGQRDIFVARLSADGSRLLYSTYLGGESTEYNPAIALNQYGDAYVAGRTFSQNFPTTGRSFQRYAGGGNCPAGPCADGFITVIKTGPDNYPSIIFSTYFGGFGDDLIDGIAVGPNDRTIYVAGRTNAPNFPVTPGAFQPTKSGDAATYDAFVARFEPSGYNLIYSSYLGGSGEDYAYDLAIDAAGSAIVTGLTGSQNFPVTPNAFQPSLNGTGPNAFDAFVAKVSADGSRLELSSFLGGSGDDVGNAVALFGPEAYIVGETSSRNLPVSPNALQPGYGGGQYDAFVARVLLTSEMRLLYMSYMGGSDTEYGRGVATQPASGESNVYLAGSTSSNDFYATPTAFQRYLGGSYYSDAFVARLNVSQDDLTVSGRVTNDYGNGLVDVEIRVTGSIDKIVRTDENGNYSFGGVPAGSNLTLTASRFGFVFSPSEVPLNDMQQSATVNFSGAAPLIIKGRITDTFGNGVSVPVTLSGSRDETTQSDYNGNYKFAQLSPGGSYTVTPASDPFRAFSPASQSVAELTSDRVFNFTVLPPLTIRGRISDEYGNGNFANLTLTADGGAIRLETTTDYQGYYQFFGLPRGKDYRLTPSKPGTLVTFAPESRFFPNLQSDQTADFTHLWPVMITGQITSAYGGGLSGVNVVLSGTVNTTTQTDYAGRYMFFELPRGGNYTVTPSLPLWTFAPESQSVVNAQSNQTFDFNALPPLMVHGRLADENNMPISGATVTLSGTVNATTETDSSGGYYFSQLPRGGNYTVTPAYPLWTFAPESQSVTNAQADQFFNFTALRPLMLTGQVTDENGNPLSGLNVQLTGTVNATAETDPSGWYYFAQLPRGGTYTVATSHELYNFTPPSQTFAQMNADQLFHFSAVFKRYRLSGRVADESGAGLAGVAVELGGGQTGMTQTDADGNYAFTNLRVALPYSVTPARAGWSFAPQSYATNDLRADQTANFIAARLNYTIRGRLADASGAALAGATLSLGGSQTATAQTDAQGNYAFTGLASEGSYTVTPSHPYYNFTPAAQTFNNLLSNQTSDFTAARINYSISGRVTDGAGAALVGLSVALGGHQAATTQTDAAGNYTFNQLPSGYAYTVTPSAAHYTFSPQTQSLDTLDANRTADFTATLLRHDIAGRITDANGAGISGATVNLSGSQNASTQTDAAGNYSFTSLPAGGNYNVTPSHAWYAFTPTGQTFDDLGANRTADFTGALLTFYLTGRVTEGTTSVAGVTVTLGGTLNGTTQTDAAGNYSFAVKAGGRYTVTPSHEWFVFSPAAASFNSLGSNQTANFAAARLTYQLSGYVRDACARPVAAVAMTLARNDGPSSAVQTDANGFYSFAGVQAGYSYTLTPASPGYTFSPSAASFPSLNANQTSDFSATPPIAINELAATADAYVQGGSSAGSNFGLATQLITRLASSTTNTYETYLTFNLGQPCTVSSVKLRLYGKLSGGSNLAVNAYAVANTAWTENGINWNNKPPAGALLTTTSVANTTAAWYEWDITNYVRSEINAGRRVVSLVLKNPAQTSNQATFNSRQATTNQPRLVVTTP